MTMVDIKTLNGYNLADTKARSELENINLELSDIKNAKYIKTFNSIAPDANGNIDFQVSQEQVHDAVFEYLVENPVSNYDDTEIKNDLKELLTYKKTNNLYNKEIAIDGKTPLFTDGSLANNAKCILSGYFPVEEGKTYVISNGIDLRIGSLIFYDANYNAICGASRRWVMYGTDASHLPLVDDFIEHSAWSDTSVSFTILDGSNISYVLWFITNNSGNAYGDHDGLDGIIDHVQVNEGDVLLPYEEYGMIITPKYISADIELKEEMKGVISSEINEITEITYEQKNLLKDAETVEDYALSVVSKTQVNKYGPYSGTWVYYKIPVSEGDLIHLKTFAGQSFNTWIFYAGDDEFEAPISYQKEATQGIYEYDIEAPKGATMLVVNVNAKLLAEPIVYKTVSSLHRKGYKDLKGEIEDLKHGGSGAENSGKVSLSIDGNNLTFASEIEDGNTLSISAYKSKREHNKTFNFVKIFANGELMKDATDDIAPLQLNIPNTSGGYIGGNHGFSNGRRLTSNHDKTVEDIGSVWKDASGNDFVIFAVNSGSVDVVNPTVTTINSPLTHVSGATHTANITFTAITTQQMYPAINRKYLSVFDENKNELTDGEYQGEYFDVVESYNLIHPLDAISFIKEHVGSNTNTSVSDESIDGYCRINCVYRFHKGCAVTMYYSIDSIKDVIYNLDGMVQSGKIGDGSYCYVPDYNDNSVFVLASQTEELSKAKWVDQNKVPYRYYQFDGSNYDMGMMICYYPKVADAVNDRRLDIITSSCGFYNGSSHKMYPYVIQKHTIEAGDSVEAICFYTPFLKMDNGSLATTYNYVGDDVILCLDYQQAIETTIELREECVGKQIEIIDKTESCVFNRKLSSSNKLPIKFTDKGYLVLRFYK